MGIESAFKSFMAWVDGAEKAVYADIVKYAPPVAKLAEMLFPGLAPEIAAGTTTVLDATGLIQNAVLMVEQKYAASGVQSGTGTQKLAEVMTLAGPAVTTLLTQAGVSASTSYIQSLVSAVVAILDVTQAPVVEAATGA